MAYNETRVTLSGVVASQVTRTTTGTGDSRAKFRLLTTERRFDPERQTWVNGAHMFLSVTCWRSLADNVYGSLGKNDPVVVHGRMTIKELPDGPGVRQFVDIDAQVVGPNLAQCTAVVTRVRKDGDAFTAPPRAAPGVAGAPGSGPVADAPVEGGPVEGGPVRGPGEGGGLPEVVVPRREGEVATLFGGSGEQSADEPGEEVAKIPF